METKFQTSFIPKRPLPTPGVPTSSIPMTAHRASQHATSLFMTIATVLLVCSLASIGAAYLWKQYLISAQADYKKELAVREQQFDIDLIRQMKAESAKISLAKQILQSHIAASKVFGLLSSLTAEHVRFTAMDFSTPANNGGTGDYQISLKGVGKDLTTVAFQAKVLNKMTDFGLRDVVRNPIVTNPSFNSNGTIAFDLSTSIDPTVLTYSVASPTASSTPGGTSSGQANQ